MRTYIRTHLSLKVFNITLIYFRFTQSAWAISNITAGTSEQIQAVLEANIFPSLIEMLQSQEVNFEVKKELVWAVANAANGICN
jgi:hypothetical protein